MLSLLALSLAQDPVPAEAPPGTPEDPLVMPPPAGTPAAAGGEPPPPSEGGGPALRGLVVRYEDPELKGTLKHPVVVLSSANGDQVLTLLDDGTGCDPVAGDNRYGAWGTTTGDGTMTAALYDGNAEGKPLVKEPVTLSADAPQVVFRIGAYGFIVDTTPDPPLAVAPGEGGRVPTGGMASMPSDQMVPPPTAALPTPAPAPSTGLPAALLWGPAVLALAGAGFVGWRLVGGPARLVPLGTPPEGRPFGLPGCPEGRVAYVVADDQASDFVGRLVGELAAWGPLVVLPRASTRPTLAALPVGTLWQTPDERPDPLKVVRAAKKLGRIAMIVEGPEAVEAPLPREAPGAVLDELSRRAKGPVLFVLRPGEPIPQGATVVAVP